MAYGRESGEQRWRRYRQAIAGESLPVALVDLDALDENIVRLRALLGPQRLRLATKSIRSPALVNYIRERCGSELAGLMTYSAAETAYLAGQGFSDLLLAYPTLQPDDARQIAELNRKITAAVVVDSSVQANALAEAAKGVRIPLVIEVDLAYRPWRSQVHLGVRRSPLRDVEEVVTLAEQIRADPRLTFHGLMGYEAQIAGLGDDYPAAPWQTVAHRALKALSRRPVREKRAELVRALTARGIAPRLVNGGGTGNLAEAAHEATLTEVTAGSGFLKGHLFDHYRELDLLPAAYFALQVVRQPAPRLWTCHGGGWIASGALGRDRLPLPVLPEGGRLLPLEGAGEVQTPVEFPEGSSLQLGDPIFFRHAKSGELAEHVHEYLLVRGDRVVDRALTYRGLGQCFLG